jgi:hypothetical protein
MSELSHIYAGDVTAAKVTDTPRHYSATGYGPKIPTSYMLQCWGVWRRVYVVNYGNAGSAYVIRGGVSHYLSPGVKLILETIRDGGTLKTALEVITMWPQWMQDGEHLTAPTPAPVAGDVFTTEDGAELLVQFVTPTLDGLKIDGRWIAEDGSIEALATYYLKRPSDGVSK